MVYCCNMHNYTRYSAANCIKDEISHPRAQGLFEKDPGISWSCDSTKINCPRGSDKVSNYMLPQKMLNFKYQEWDFTIYSLKRPLTSILYLCLLSNYKNTVAFYQQSSQETKCILSTLKLGILSQISVISNWSVVNVCAFSLLSVPKIFQFKFNARFKAVHGLSLKIILIK